VSYFKSLALILLFISAYPHNGIAAVSTKKSIREWVSCTGTADDTSGAMEAFAAARGNAFTLVVDCPVRLHSGLAVDRGIFIDNGTTVVFSGAGKFFVDNMFHPAFVIANSNNITLTNWNVEWDGSVPVNPNFGGYELGGKMVAKSGETQPAGAFNDLVLTPWLQANRQVKFNEARGWVAAYWVGGVNPAAVFYITGNSANIVFSGMKLYVPATAGANHFMPMAISLSQNWKSGLTITAETPVNTQYMAVPHALTFSNITLDGTIMGWQGNAQDVLFENINSHRYSDLQDAQGKNVGGIGKWFPPPHLFYLNHPTVSNPALYNTNIHFESVLDSGPRLGTARDKGGSDTQSGFANSLKLGCSDCSVDHYGSTRPDGFMDVLESSNLTVSNVFASFNTNFLNNLYSAAVRFPEVGYSHVTFENIQWVDTAASTIRGPVGNASSTSNVAIVFDNVNVDMTHWAGSNIAPMPAIAGNTNTVDLEFESSAQPMHASYVMNNTVSSLLVGTPSTARQGSSTLLTWRSWGGTGCTASGEWSGNVGGSGTRVVKLGTADNYDFGLACKNSAHTTKALLTVATE
jgi:hypothetical protein